VSIVRVLGQPLATVVLGTLDTEPAPGIPVAAGLQMTARQAVRIGERSVASAWTDHWENVKQAGYKCQWVLLTQADWLC
jgi:hypothetical protein